jgi:formate hydrogenlyase subunit 3/multisubunit Na+/H+ antiporter MnhD subunit
MTLASYFLVTFEDEKTDVQKAGWTYLIATHIGTAFLLAFFAFIVSETGSLNFNGFAGLQNVSAFKVSMMFLLALIGFGTKAGFVPLHIWLPEAHPAAPSHVSAIMSGIMIKTGIYGLCRVLTFIGTPQIWWGWCFVGIGVVSCVLGVLFALAQHDLKRLLAYHSVENIGIIALGMGIGLLGNYSKSDILAALGWSGALLHVVNHALFKGLLFLDAGTILHETGIKSMDKLGGLLKKMPVTGFTFLVGAIAISGLPPLNGFISEFLIYRASLEGAVKMSSSFAIPALITISGLAMIGCLAAACFAKAFGIVFLGENRSPGINEPHDPSILMKLPVIILAGLCFAVGILSPWIMKYLFNAVEPVLVGMDAQSLQLVLPPVKHILLNISLAAIILFALIGCLIIIRLKLLKNRVVGKSVTWDCGYAAPAPSMQYTASSFIQPIIDMFQSVLHTHKDIHQTNEHFPVQAHFKSETADIFREYIYEPVFRITGRLIMYLRWLQHGNIHIYVLYIAVTLIALLLWNFGF